MNYQSLRKFSRSLFFLLFIFAPILDIFRFDLSLGHFILFGQPWQLDIIAKLQGQGDATDAAIIIFTKMLLPLFAFVGITGWLVWRYGRIYCGWLCPHFSIVELINGVMLRQLNRVTLWEQASKASNGRLPKLVVFVVAVSLAFVWAVSLMTYILPPQQVLVQLVHFDLNLAPAIFVMVATTVFTIDFVFARHLFCTYGCALGIFQSLIWMANKKSMIVKFDRTRAKACRDCNAACDTACPMRLPTRNMKRAKFTCTQCAQCITACQEVQKDNPQGSLLDFTSGDDAVKLDRKASRYSQDDQPHKIIKIKNVE